MTHDHVIRFGETYGIDVSSESTSAMQRRQVEAGIAELIPKKFQRMSEVAVQQLLEHGGGPAVDFVVAKILTSKASSEEAAEPEVSHEATLEQAIDEARTLIRDLWDAKALDRLTIKSLADVMSLKHTMLQDMPDPKRVLLAQSTVTRLVNDLESAQLALGEDGRGQFSEYKRIIKQLDSPDLEIPTLLQRSKQPVKRKEESRDLTPKEQSEQYIGDLICLTNTIRLTYLGEDTRLENGK